MSKYLIKTSREIIWCAPDDRFILVVKECGDIVGLNFMQGEEYALFLDEYSDIDVDLTKFYLAIENAIPTTFRTEIERINQAMWAWLSYKNDL